MNYMISKINYPDSNGYKYMIIWDREQNEWLKTERGLSFEEIAEKIINGEIVDIVKNPSRDD